MRAPGCLPSDELACDAPTAAGATIDVQDVGTAIGAGRTAFVFIEFPPDDAGELAPFDVEVLLSTVP
jgi:hypothetical protein